MRCWRTVQTHLPFLLVCGALVYFATPGYAQESQDTSEAQEGATSQQLHYADESTPQNSVVVDLNEQTAYDDNVFGDNADRVGSTILQGGAHFGLQEERERSALSLDYQPEALFYTAIPGYNQANHYLSLKAKYDPARHFELRFEDTGSYLNGISSPGLNANASPALALSPTFNQTTIVPLARVFTDEGRADAIYQSSRRSTLDFFGSAGDLNFSAVANLQESLFNTQAYRGGVDYTYRWSANSTVGISALHENLRYGPSMDEIESPSLTYTWQGKSGLLVSLYGGPEYLRLNDVFISPGVVSSAPGLAGARNRESSWNGGGGFSLSWRSTRTIVTLSGQRLATDSGGFFTSVMNTAGSFDVRRSLIRHWDLLIDGVAAQSASLSPLFRGAALHDQTGSLKIERQLSSRLVVQVGYNAGRQRVYGDFPFLFDMNRNYISLGFFYRVGHIPLGRH